MLITFVQGLGGDDVPLVNENCVQKVLLSIKISVALPQTRASTLDLVLYKVYSLFENKEDISGLLSSVSSSVVIK